MICIGGYFIWRFLSSCQISQFKSPPNINYFTVLCIIYPFHCTILAKVSVQFLVDNQFFLIACQFWNRLFGCFVFTSIINFNLGVNIPLTVLYQIEFVDGCFVFISIRNFDLGLNILFTVLYQIEFVDLYYLAAHFPSC